MVDKQVKFKIINLDEILIKLRNSDAIFIGGTFEKITLFDNQNFDLRKKGLFLRSKDGFENTLTLKEKKEENTEIFTRIKTSIEIEDVDDINYILTKIGFTNKSIMEKYRLLWSVENIEISIDELPFGLYMEIKGNEAKIKKFCTLLGLKKDDIINKTYWDLYYELQKDGKNIVFPENHVYLLGSFI